MIFCFWFFLGFIFYKKLLKPYIINPFFNKLILFNLLLLILTIIIIKKSILDLVIKSFLINLDINNLNLNNYEIFQNISGNITNNIYNSYQFLPDDFSISEFISQHVGLTGNDGIDFLILIQYIHKWQLFFLIILCYNLFISYIKEEKIENFLLKIFPSAHYNIWVKKIINSYIKAFKLAKKTNLIIIIWLLILLIVSNYVCYYYLDFYITNLDKIIEISFKK